MTKRLEFPRKVRAAAIERASGRCENPKCGAILKPGEAEIDHILPNELGGQPVLANAQVLCGPCHKAKTAVDVKAIRKSDRQRDKASGAIKPKGQITSRGFDKGPKPSRLPQITRRARPLYERTDG